VSGREDMPRGWIPSQGPLASCGQDRAFLQTLLTLVNRFGDQQATHGTVLVQLGSVDPDSAANQTPVAQGFDASIAELRKRLQSFP
jgi:hypothetical protein